MKIYQVVKGIHAFCILPFFIIGFFFQHIKQSFSAGRKAVEDLTDWIDLNENNDSENNRLFIDGE